MPQLVTLCGIEPEKEDIDLSRRDLDAGDAKLLAFDLSRNQMIKSLILNGNNLGTNGNNIKKRDMSGILKLAEALPKSQLTFLRSAKTPLNFT